MLTRATVYLLVLAIHISLCHGGLHFSNCPNGCSSHGVCANSSSIGTCQCFPSYTGTDCSLRVCPSSTAWVDVPSSDTAAHAPFTECSNMVGISNETILAQRFEHCGSICIQGTCDRSTGQCVCRLGFEGAACDTSKWASLHETSDSNFNFANVCNIQLVMCPVATLTSSIPEGTNITAVCSGNGRCASLREVTGYQTFNTRLDYTQYTGWDADKIRGCLCEPGWSGIACEKRLCPKGDDPVLAGELGSNTAEVQLIDCLCTDCKGIDMSAALNTSLSLTLHYVVLHLLGGLYISFAGQQTPLIPYDASEELIRYRLLVGLVRSL
jgi:hypothetical protein